MAITWEVGVLTVPGTTGTVSVTGMTSQPAAVFFFGTNWLTEDAADTGAGRGLFRGMAAPQWDSPSTILNSSECVIPAGDANHSAGGACTNMLTTAGVVVDASSFLHIGEVTAFNSDGFDLDWQVVTAGGYKVVYAALLNATNVGGYIGAGTTIPFGWKAGASLLHGSLGGLDTGDSDQTHQFYGGGAYPGTSSPSWFGAGLTSYAFPGSTGSQYINQIFDNQPSTVVAQAARFIGPALTSSNVLAFPSGTGLEDFTMQFTNDTGGMLVAWDDEDSETGLVSTPGADEDDVVAVTGLPFRPGLVLGYTVSDEPDGQGSFDAQGSRGAVGFSVIAEGFQWCATADGKDARGAFQSFSRGFADVVNGSNVHAGTVALTHDGFEMTTVEDTVVPNDWVWHAFGHPEQILKWIPQIYRRLFATGGAGPVPPVPPADFLLLGGGTDRLLLETGGDFLIL